MLQGCYAVDNYSVLSRKISIREYFADSDFVKIDEKEIPEKYILDVPFVMQAPLANWDEHNESCEEAGLLLVHYYYQQEELSKDRADQELKDMVSFEIKNYGLEKDIYSDEMAQLASDYYDYNNSRIIIGTRENIITEILKDNPVIVPTTAAYLKPEKSDYPEMGYHVIVIIGYDSTGFIVHDPGTCTGERTHYSYGVIEQAIADYDRRLLVLR